MPRHLLTAIATILAIPLIVNANIDPNLTEPIAPGWSAWRPSSETKQADFAAGFSNLELGSFSDFKSACSRALGIASSDPPYWFRLNSLIDQIGTGQVEYGCLVDGNITTTLRITAIKESLKNVTCLQINSTNGKDLPVYVEPQKTAKVIRVLRNTSRVNPGSFPAIVVEQDGLNWVAITSPAKGWVLQGDVGSTGNLRLCSAPKR